MQNGTIGFVYFCCFTIKKVNMQNGTIVFGFVKLNVSGSKHKKNKIIHFRFGLDRKIRGQFFFFLKKKE